MLKFETQDEDLVIWINGNTKRPDALSQQELETLQKLGDARVTNQVETPTKTKSAKAEA